MLNFEKPRLQQKPVPVSDTIDTYPEHIYQDKFEVIEYFKELSQGPYVSYGKTEMNVSVYPDYIELYHDLDLEKTGWGGNVINVGYNVMNKISCEKITDDPTKTYLEITYPGGIIHIYQYSTELIETLHKQTEQYENIVW